MIGFHWIVKGELSGASQPGLYGDWGSDISFLRNQGINFVMSLTEEPLIQENLAQESDFGFYHFPIRDMDAPMPRPAHEAIMVLNKAIARGNKVLIHCKGGVGRTGMIGACYLVTKGYAAEDAITKVRQIHQPYIQTRNQELFVSHFEQFLKNLE